MKPIYTEAEVAHMLLILHQQLIKTDITDDGFEDIYWNVTGIEASSIIDGWLHKMASQEVINEVIDKHAVNNPYK